MKIVVCLALVAASVAPMAALTPTESTPSAQRKLMFAPGYDGPPCADMLCPEDYVPVCGSDGVTYNNECQLDITSCNEEKNDSLVSTGACPSSAPAQRKLMFAPGYDGPPCADMLCPEDYVPVCGSDGVTYNNECQLGITSCNEEKNVSLVSTGACLPSTSFVPEHQGPEN